MSILCLRGVLCFIASSICSPTLFCPVPGKAIANSCVPPPQLNTSEENQKRADAAGELRADCLHQHEGLSELFWATPTVEHVVELCILGFQPWSPTSCDTNVDIENNIFQYFVHCVCSSHKLNLVLCGGRSQPRQCPLQT